MNNSWRICALAAAVQAGISACLDAPPRPAAAPGVALPGISTSLAIGSAGYTGCLPAENMISNVNAIDRVGSKTWNVTCKGKVYLCSAVASIGFDQGSYSCALAIQ